MKITGKGLYKDLMISMEVKDESKQEMIKET